MTELRQLEWPPLVVGASVPTWVRVRDVVLTLLAWLLLLWAMRYGLALTVDFLRPPVFEFSSMEPPNWIELGHRLHPFMIFVAVLLVWILSWALVRGRAMRVADGALQPQARPQPPPLAPKEHAASFGLAAHQVDAWRGARVMVVHLADDDLTLRGEIRQPM